MYFIDKENRALIVIASLGLGGFDRFSNFLYACEDGIDGNEVGVGGVGDNSC